MNDELHKICVVSTSDVLHCECSDCCYHVQHYKKLDDWLIVNPRTVDCIDKEKMK